MSQITHERIRELETDLKRATEWADMRTEEVARLEARLAVLGESPAAIERAKTTPRVHHLIHAYAGEEVAIEGPREDGAPKAFGALLAVVDLHQHAAAPSDGSWCMHCSTGGDTEGWPCPTVLAITAALEGS